jgi:hypothetical protein
MSRLQAKRVLMHKGNGNADLSSISSCSSASVSPSPRLPPLRASGSINGRPGGGGTRTGRAHLALVISDDKMICYELDDSGNLLENSQEVALRSPRTFVSELSSQFQYARQPCSQHSANGRRSVVHSRDTSEIAMELAALAELSATRRKAMNTPHQDAVDTSLCQDHGASFARCSASRPASTSAPHLLSESKSEMSQAQATPVQLPGPTVLFPLSKKVEPEDADSQHSSLYVSEREKDAYCALSSQHNGPVTEERERWQFKEGELTHRRAGGCHFIPSSPRSPSGGRAPPRAPRRAPPLSPPAPTAHSLPPALVLTLCLCPSKLPYPTLTLSILGHMLASASHAFATESSHCQRSPQLLYLTTLTPPPCLSPTGATRRMKDFSTCTS